MRHQDLAVPVLALAQLLARKIHHEPVQPLGSLRVGSEKCSRYLLYFSRLLLLHKPAGGVRVNHGKGVELPGLGLGEGHLGLGLGLGHRQGVAVFSRDLFLHILHLTIDKSTHLFEDCSIRN